MKLNTDGAMKKSIGMASPGGLVRDHYGNWGFGFKTKINITNSVATKLWGLRKDLRLVTERCFARIIMELDYASLVSIMKGEKIKTWIITFLC